MSDISENPAKDTRRSPQADSPVFVPSPRIISASEHSDDDGDNRAQEEEGYELKKLERKTADNVEGDSEDDRLLSEKSDDGRTSGEVLYAADSSDAESSIRSRRKPMKRPEFLYTREDERTVVRKLDKYLIGGLAVLYMLSFLDRSNIGNAKIAGMEEDLDLKGDRYEWLLTAFYITYILFQWTTLCWKVFPAHKYVAFCVVGWGSIATLQALSINWVSMVILRAFLGVFEAAFGPGVPFYLSLFYRREELALRTGLFISAAPLATAYAGFLAYAITSIPSEIAPWRLLFLLEGFPSIIAGVCAYYLIPDTPAECRFLERDQKKIARRRLLVVRDDEEDTGTVISTEEGRGLRWKEVWKAFGDLGNWITALIFFFSNVSFASIPVFLPTVIKEMDADSDMTSAHAQILSIPPYLFAFLLILLTTHLSDRLRSRSGPLLVLTSLSALGYSLLAFSGLLHESMANISENMPHADESHIEFWGTRLSSSTALYLSSRSSTLAMSYLGIMLSAGTIFSIVSITITWNGNNAETESSRGAGLTILQLLGQCGPLLGTRLYPSKDGPEYIRGSLVCAGCMGVVVMLVGTQRWRLIRENRRRERLDARDDALEGDSRRGRRFRFMV
ncbi:major facilitator superfamily domain-containing protein [Pyronema omphalodes]|nr:major facilitator superfamily domain-containing protein [Pyronema omphalodes]